MQTILITGAAKRIGKAIALSVFKNYNVIIHYNHSKNDAIETAQEISALGGQVDIIQQDLCAENAAFDLFNHASKVFGSIDVIINSASIFLPDTLDELSYDLWQKHHQIHVNIPMQLTQLLYKHISDPHKGNIINILDQRIHRPTPQFFSYTASKLSMASLTRYCAIACSPKIRVNGIAPGAVLPSMRQTPQDFEKQANMTPLKTPVSVSDITNAVTFILNSPSMTGEIITLDSGQNFDWQTPNFLECVE